MVLLTLILKKLDGPIRSAGPVAIAVILLFGLELTRGTSYFTLAPLFTVLAMAIYYGGWKSGSIVSVLIIGYSVYAGNDLNVIRSVIIALSAIGIIAPISILRLVSDNTNTIRAELRDVDIQLVGILKRWPNITEAEKREAVTKAHYKVAHILTLAAGWLELIHGKNSVIRQYENRKT